MCISNQILQKLKLRLNCFDLNVTFFCTFFHLNFNLISTFSVYISIPQYITRFLLLIIIFVIYFHHIIFSVNKIHHKLVLPVPTCPAAHTLTHHLLMTPHQPRAACQPSHSVSERKSLDSPRSSQVDVAVVAE